MSTDAPWIALAIDFTDSAMFRELPMSHSATATAKSPEHRASHGEVLAWVCLLCWTKAFGRGGKARVVKSDFANRFHLSGRSVEGMLSRAQKCAAVKIDGEYVTICNWDSYQGKGASAKYRKRASIPEQSSTVVLGGGDGPVGGPGVRMADPPWLSLALELWPRWDPAPALRAEWVVALADHPLAAVGKALRAHLAASPYPSPTLADVVKLLPKRGRPLFTTEELAARDKRLADAAESKARRAAARAVVAT